MSKISTYINAPSPISGSDKLIGTNTNGVVENATKNFTVTELQTFIFKNGNSLLSFANNAAAISGGLVAGNIYRTSTGEIRIVF